ncbi:MAG: CZB domain-containing protein [Nitrospirota bacterium]
MGFENDIKNAIGDHGIWKKKLKSAVDTGKIADEISTIRSDDSCDFGKWLHRPSTMDNQKDSKHYKKVCKLHADFHEKAALVAQLAVAGNKTAAMKMLDVNGEYVEASATLTAAMLAWLKETKSER